MKRKEWFVVYQYDTYSRHNPPIIYEVFIYGEGTAQDAWLKFKDAEDKLISIT